MLYKSTRSVKGKTYKASQVILRGLAPDGGLFMPTEIPKILPSEWKELAAMSYPELAANILHRYLSDYTEAELLEDAKAAYGAEKFPDGATDLRMVTPRIFSLELWHGPTCAFKDMALQMMPRLMSRALKKNKEKKTAMILVATSGDTGKAALEGYRDVDGIKIKVFYPAEGVSDTQKLQMTTQEGDNVSVSGIVGNFDDAQGPEAPRRVPLLCQLHQLGQTGSPDRLLRARLSFSASQRRHLCGTDRGRVCAYGQLRQHSGRLLCQGDGNPLRQADLRLQPK